MTSILLLDNKTASYYRRLAPHRSGYGTDKPLEISGACWLPKPVIATVNHWIHDSDHDVVDPVKEQRMKQMFSGNVY